MTGPAVGFFVGIVVSVLWAGMVNIVGGSDLSYSSMVLLVAAGFMGSAGATAATLLVAMASGRTHGRLHEAEHLARHDPLTGLVNRSELFKELDSSLAYAAENDMVLGVLFLDLDRFKTINDSLGHEVGDELLRIVADRLKSTVRNTDVVARLGGDEFVVLCRGLLLGQSVVASAKQILKAFKEPITLNGKSHVVSTSIGVAIAEPTDNREADSLVSDADAAMYRAKRTKAGVAVFDEAHRQMVADQLDIERALMNAIKAGEIVVYYQPIVHAGSRFLHGFEALVRWHHPERGLIPPNEFLTAAVEGGMMQELDTLVLKEACAQLSFWNHSSPSANQMRIGVNLSEQQLTNEALPALVSETLAWSGVNPHQLVLEITEDLIVDHLEGLTVLRQLRDLGVSLSIDDFGTGQSSLSYLKQFDMVSSLKIDQSFVREMHVADADRAIIEAVVSMASALELEVVAEGVENEIQLNALQGLGVKLIQGYLFGAAVPADQIDPATMFPANPTPMPFDSKAISAAEIKIPNVPDQLIDSGIANGGAAKPVPQAPLVRAGSKTRSVKRSPGNADNSTVNDPTQPLRPPGNDRSGSRRREDGDWRPLHRVAQAPRPEAPTEHREPESSRRRA